MTDQFKSPVEQPEHVNGPQEGTSLPFDLVIGDDQFTTQIKYREGGKQTIADRNHRLLWREYIRMYNLVLAMTGGGDTGALERWNVVEAYVVDRDTTIFEGC